MAKSQTANLPADLPADMPADLLVELPAAPSLSEPGGYPLRATLDTAAAGPLRQDLLAQLDGGRPLVLDGGGVRRVGQACLQVLAGARAAADARGLGFTIAAPSEALCEMARLAGLAMLVDAAG